MSLLAIRADMDARANALRQSDMLRHDPAGPPIRLWRDVDRPEVVVVDVLQGHGHHFALAVDVDAAEELQAETRREIVALLRAAAFLKHRLRAKGVVELARRPCPGMQGAGDEFPERLELLEHCAVRIVMVRAARRDRA